MTDQAARAAHAALLPEEVYRRALAVGRRARGVSGPNPPVGCLVLQDGEVIAEAATGPAGEAHAEVVALAGAGARAAGATAVVTLEPCAHVGRTGPCVDALVTAGVGQVHVLLRDPDPAAAGGLERLVRAGIGVLDVGDVRPDLAAAAAMDLRGFLTRVRAGRPHVTLKLAQTVAGDTVPPAGAYLTGVAARSHVHALRADCDAVLVGGGTVRSDDPRLDVRLAAAARQPRPVVLSRDGDLPDGARVLRSGALVLTGAEPPASTVHRLRSHGAEVIEVPRSDDGSGLDLHAALAALLDHRILTVLAEPGARLAAALVDADLADSIELHVAGGAGAADIRPALPQLATLLDGATHERTVTGDGDLLLRSGPVVARSARPALGRVA